MAIDFAKKFRFREFKVYKDARIFSKELKQLSKKFPKEELYCLTSQLWRALNSIILNIENNVAYILLNRPEVFNSFNREMALRFKDELDNSESNKDVRAIVISGKGKAFCAGRALKKVKSPEVNP